MHCSGSETLQGPDDLFEYWKKISINHGVYNENTVFETEHFEDYSEEIEGVELRDLGIENGFTREEAYEDSELYGEDQYAGEEL